MSELRLEMKCQVKTRFLGRGFPTVELELEHKPLSGPEERNGITGRLEEEISRQEAGRAGEVLLHVAGISL